MSEFNEFVLITLVESDEFCDAAADVLACESARRASESIVVDYEVPLFIEWRQRLQESMERPLNSDGTPNKMECPADVWKASDEVYGAYYEALHAEHVKRFAWIADKPVGTCPYLIAENKMITAQNRLRRLACKAMQVDEDIMDFPWIAEMNRKLIGLAVSGPRQKFVQELAGLKLLGIDYGATNVNP